MRRPALRSNCPPCFRPRPSRWARAPRLCGSAERGHGCSGYCAKTVAAASDHDGEGAVRGRSGYVSRPRLGGDCGHHQLHQHFESIGDGGGGNSGEEGRGERPDCAAVGEDFAGAGFARGDGLLHQGRACCRISKSCASMWWATAAPLALATPGRCPPTFQRASTSMGWLR